ncbi:hypothetical protein HYH02_013197 [Chlamydomonas schloesseri]|uniref:thiamine phosphate synthase n=1 Tax=Chlamydomonas schloesseri TaxID=2026947 RepID=A0A835W0V0_9CHLO|nr:hypothetical protein HYH02_013197 [Chlamydomonas schloesseri]|eukprot:KAG2431981.1 hypothetical protein HYH02_013197 [Chlamydomonas schloesseri]
MSTYPITGLPTTEGLAKELWESTQHEVFMSLHDPFVQGMAQGTLDKRAFQHYVAQDAYFLHYFARAYGIALSKALALDEQTFEDLTGLLRGVHEELRLHGSYAAKWGVDMTVAGTRPSAATKAYTDFLMDVADEHGQDGSVAEILAAMLPCARLYGFLGAALAGCHGPELAAGAGAGAQPPSQGDYWEWVKTYSSDDYLSVPGLKERMFERLAGKDADRAKLLGLYRRAMQLEAEFFAAQPYSPPPRRFSALVVDFDETCTPKDTIGGLMALAAAAAAQPGRPTAGDGAWAAATSARLADDYMAAQRQLLARLLPDGEPDAAAYDAAGLDGFLAALSDFDEAMNAPVEECGILKGSTAAEVAAAGAALQLRPQCREVLGGALSRGIPVHVLSVNWSDVYVGAALTSAAAAASGKLAVRLAGEAAAAAAAAVDSGGKEPAVELRCNSLELDGSGLTTGALRKRVQSARDKRAALAELRARLPADAADSGSGSSGSSSSSSNPAALAYVGDSTSDLGAMLDSDFGIVIGSNALLRRVCRRFGIRILPLGSAPLDPRRVPPGTLYEAIGGWAEVRAFLFGVERPSEAAAAAPAVGGGAANSTAVEAAVAAVGAGSCSSTSLPRVLSIAGSDSGGGAGIQADIKALLSRGVFAMTALTALTAQNTHGVSAVHAVPPDFLRRQIDAVLGDLGADAIKTGMLPNAECVAVVAEAVRSYRGAGHALPLVVDPVLVSTSGHALAEGGVAAALLRQLIPLATVVTPNLPEAQALLGGEQIVDVEGMRRAAKQLQAMTGCAAVLVKGGHLRPPPPPPPTANGDAATSDPVAESIDVLYDGSSLHEFRGPWIHTGNTHGTGCTLASAISAELAKGLPLLPAVAAARAALLEALRASAPLALGSGVQRPFHHLHMLPVGAPTPSPTPSPAAPVPSAAPHLARYDLGALRRQLRLYAVTDPHCNTKTGRSLLEAVTAAVRGGVTILQIREKDIDGGNFFEEAAAALKVCRAYGVPLIINDRVDVALAVGAEGVHVGQSDLPAAVVRAMIGPARILGVSVKTPEQAAAARAAGADYLGAGAVLPTGTKDTDVIGLAGLAAVAAAAAPLPIVAIGGVSGANAADCVNAGCAGIAVVSAIFAQTDAEGAARSLLAAVDDALAAQKKH